MARVIVIGAGPAGVRAAETLEAAGLSPILVDEGRREGGQIYRRQPDGFTRPYAALYGSEAKKAAALHRSFAQLGPKLDYRPECLAWNIEGRTLHVTSAGGAEALPFEALIICSGATDRLLPVRGWQMAGVYSLGGAQIALKSQACAIGRRVAFLGTGPLLYLVASQYRKAGAQVAAVLDTSPLGLRIGALPSLAARPGLLAKGLCLTAGLYLAGVPVKTGIIPTEIRGSPEKGVEGLLYRDAEGRPGAVEVDAVALGWHLRPETQLADLARCQFTFDEASRQWFPEIDQDGRSSVPGVYLAGDGARILGADGAEAAGSLAALAALADLGHAVDATRLQTLRRTLARMDRFRRGLAQAFPWPAALARQMPDKTILCRCEGVTAGTLRHSVDVLGAPEMNRAKAFSRVGMGRCQGRYCASAAAELMAASTGLPLHQVGRLRGQAPVKPISIATESAS